MERVEEPLRIAVSAFHPWRMAAAAIAGADHRSRGIDCQDCYHISTIVAVDGQRLLLLILADGAGSAAEGRRGASLTCEFLAERIGADLSGAPGVAGLDRARFVCWLGALRQRLSDQAAAAGHRLRDYATTLSLALVGAMEPELHGVFLQLGDCAMVYRGEGDWQIAAWPQRGEFANSTFFVTDEACLQQFELVTIPEPITEVALFSDGLERLLLTHHQQAIYQPFFDQIFQTVRQQAQYGIDANLSDSLAHYLHSPPIASRCDDDCSLILATQLPPEVLPVLGERRAP